VTLARGQVAHLAVEAGDAGDTAAHIGTEVLRR
jgi:hypothetical protein